MERGENIDKNFTFTSSSSSFIGEINTDGSPSANSKASSETYYNSDDGFKYYSIINSVDYSGIGLWDHMVEHVDPMSGRSYKRGDGRSIRDATMERDKYVLDLIRREIPDNK